MQSSKYVTVRLLSDHPETLGDPSEPISVALIEKSDAEWKKLLGTEVWRILRAKGTESPFCGALLNEKERGIYFCAGCGLPVFHSDTKFHSGTGWPSFYQPFAKENLVEVIDRSHGMTRTEILCTRCGGHLGHVFPDGPPPTHLRYCINSGALTFRSLSDIQAESQK